MSRFSALHVLPNRLASLDYRGGLNEFEARLWDHICIARHLGPYKISVHSGSDKFSVYPLLGACVAICCTSKAPDVVPRSIAHGGAL